MTVTSAKADIVADIVAANLTDVTVLDYEPAAVNRGLTVTVQTAQVQPTDYLFAVSIYASNNDPQLAQRSLDLLMPAVEAALGAAYGPITWEVDLDVVDTGDVALATASVIAPREDF